MFGQPVTAGKRITLVFGKLNVCFSRRKLYLGRENSVRWHREFAYRRHVMCNAQRNISLMKPKYKEFIFSLVIILIAYLFYNPRLIWVDEESTYDINIYDTYFVIESSNILLLTIFTFLFLAYLIKAFYFKLKNILVNCYFLISNILFIIAVSYIIFLINSIVEREGQTIYPPLSAESVTHEGNGFEKILYILIGFQILLVILEVFVAKKTAKLYKGQST